MFVLIKPGRKIPGFPILLKKSSYGLLRDKRVCYSTLDEVHCIMYYHIKTDADFGTVFNEHKTKALKEQQQLSSPSSQATSSPPPSSLSESIESNKKASELDIATETFMNDTIQGESIHMAAHVVPTTNESILLTDNQQPLLFMDDDFDNVNDTLPPPPVLSDNNEEVGGLTLQEASYFFPALKVPMEGGALTPPTNMFHPSAGLSPSQYLNVGPSQVNICTCTFIFMYQVCNLCFLIATWWEWAEYWLPITYYAATDSQFSYSGRSHAIFCDSAHTPYNGWIHTTFCDSAHSGHSSS